MSKFIDELEQSRFTKDPDVVAEALMRIAEWDGYVKEMKDKKCPLWKEHYFVEMFKEYSAIAERLRSLGNDWRRE